ncbi:precorrin-6y C5,15-methyltransferase (decarboxylating) subunit CbiE [Almyronema epifaneia]|uniref:Precorrin-6y C5,15-methyltransferase (Decarboxylating) subunit CbiE n=1 Tax=Almyronema epifaneia S1 TaxID=2991925 RepID=A0ABW6IAX2_9CYAN
MSYPPIQVVGVGAGGKAELSPAIQSLIAQADLLVGSDRHLSYFPQETAQRLALSPLSTAIETLQAQRAQQPQQRIVILTSGDPLFFGLGRLLLQHFAAEELVFHPHLSSIQLAFSRLKLPWQDAQIVSLHGRSLDNLLPALKQGSEKIAILTDERYPPQAIAAGLLSLSAPYQLWVCENLGAKTERVHCYPPGAVPTQTFDPLNVVVLIRQPESEQLDLSTLPSFGLADELFLSFSDRPGLITKREVRLLVLGELALKPHQVVWDIGAGTGSVSIEIARLQPSATVYAIEKTAVGATLIQQNCQRLGVETVKLVQQVAPAALASLPAPDRVFIGGSGGHLAEILQVSSERLQPGGRIVLALATLEHLSTVLTWRQQCLPDWRHWLLQVQLSRSAAVADLTRWLPLNPITLVVLSR